MVTFKKDIDMTNRNAMEDFLTNHYRYFTGNSWNQSTSYANCVKIYKLGIADKEIENRMYEAASLNPPELAFIVNDLIDDFKAKTSYTAGFNGRSDGYIVLYETNGVNVYPYKGIDQFAVFEDEDQFSLNDLKERCKLVTEFDELCDNILAAYIDFCKTHKVEKVTVTRVEEVETFVPITEE